METSVRVVEQAAELEELLEYTRGQRDLWYDAYGTLLNSPCACPAYVMIADGNEERREQHARWLEVVHEYDLESLDEEEPGAFAPVLRHALNDRVAEDYQTYVKGYLS
jgi:hypothetical protein